MSACLCGKREQEITMNKIIIANYGEVEAQVINRDGNSFAVKPVVSEADASRCAANFVEVEPGQFAYGYHYHEVNEEVFYIIRGHAIVRTPSGEKKLKEGDAIAFPANPDGAHVIRNGSATEKLVYLDVGSRLMPDVVHFPDTASGMVISSSGVHHFCES